MKKKELPRLGDDVDLKGKYVLLRASFNVPLQDGEVLNQFRILRALPTIHYLIKREARIIIIAHIGRDPKNTLRPVFDVLAKSIPLTFSEELIGEAVIKKRDAMQDGDVLLLENLRSDPREKKNDPDFVRELAALADIYVDDAFAVAHRSHSSVVGIPTRLPSYFGYNFCTEYDELFAAMTPASPSLFMLGGAKFDTKMPLIEKYVDTYDHVFVGGALANDIFRARGHEIGRSLVSDFDLQKSNLLSRENLLVPIDVVVKSESGIRVVSPDAVQKQDTILDAGPDTVAMLADLIADAKMILWNGPLGDYEHGFDKETIAVAKHVADADGYSVIGGGDTVASIEVLCTQKQFGFLSTAGGAMLTFLEHGTLPAIEAVMNK